MRILTVDISEEIGCALARQPGVELMSLTRHRGTRGLVPRAESPRAFYYPAGSKLSWQACQSVRQAIVEFQPDLVQAFLSRGVAHTVFATVGLANPPKIVAFRGITSRLSRWDPANWITFLNPKIDAYACESDAIRQALVGSGIEAGRCWVTYNGVNLATSSNRTRESLLEQLQVPTDAFVVGTVANMRPVKGIDLLLKAAIACRDLKDVYWVLLGEPTDPLVRRLAEDPRIKDRVRLVGYHPQAKELISAADLFVMPSRSEGLCRALLEAMAAGICPIVSDAGGMKEVVRHRRDGLVFPRESIEQLAAAIRLLYEDRNLVSTFAISARRRIAESFSCEKMALRMVEGYRGVLGFESRGSQSAA